MAANSSNIVVGAATITVNGTDVGYTRDGVQIRHASDFTDIMADQANGVVKKFRNAERMFIKFTMLEITLENLKLACMQPDQNLSGSTLTFGYNDACWVAENNIVIVGKGPSCGTRTWNATKCVITGERSIEQKRDEPQVLEVEFEVLKNSSGNFLTCTNS